MTLAPLVLAGLLTLATCVLLGLKLNFANVIALPLLLGIGVAFNIYFVVAWRHGQRCFLASSLTRAVIFSAATTASGFGTLWLSVHPGTASMGELLMISLGWVLVTTLFLSPALLGPPCMRCGCTIRRYEAGSEKGPVGPSALRANAPEGCMPVQTQASNLMPPAGFYPSIWSVSALIFFARPCGPPEASVAAKSERFCAIWLILPASSMSVIFHSDAHLMHAVIESDGRRWKSSSCF